MNCTSQSEIGHWANGELPANVLVGQNSIITGAHAFNRFVSRKHPGLVIGDHCTLDGVHFAIGGDGLVTIGNYCYLTNALLLCELELRIGSYVLMGWNATIADTDFHPIAPAERIAKILLPAETLSQPAPKIEPGPARIGRGRDSVGPLQGTIVAAEQAVSFSPRGGRKHHMRLLAPDIRKRPEEGH